MAAWRKGIAAAVVASVVALGAASPRTSLASPPPRTEHAVGEWTVSIPLTSSEHTWGHLLDAHGRKVLTLKGVDHNAPFQLVEGRYLFWYSGGVMVTDLRDKASRVVASRETVSRFRVSPRRARIAFASEEAIWWRALDSGGVERDKVVYRLPPLIPKKPGWGRHESFRLLDWSSDEKRFWFCRYVHEGDAVNAIVLVEDEGTTFYPMPEGTLAPCVTRFVMAARRPKAYQHVDVSAFDSNRGLAFLYTRQLVAPTSSLWLYDVVRRRRAFLGFSSRAPVTSLDDHTAILHTDGSCSYDTIDGHHFVPDAEWLFTSSDSAK